MDFKHAVRFVMYGVLAGVTLGSVAMLLGLHSVNLTNCVLQFFVISLLGAVIGLAVAYGLGRLLSHLNNFLIKARRPAKWLLKWLLIVTLLFVVGSLIYAKYEPNIWLHQLGSADRIIVRDGGYDCCGPVNDEVILFEVKDPVEIKKLLDSLDFAGKDHPCNCCGFPGIDWYRGSDRIALTALQHGNAIRYHGGELRLSEKSSESVVSWLTEHGVSAKEIEGGCGGPRRNIRRENALLKLAQECVARGDAYAEKNDFEKALVEFNNSIRYAPRECALVYYKRGLAREKNGDFYDAIRDFTDAIQINQTDATLSEIKKDANIEKPGEALGLNGSLAITYFARGRCYDKIDEKSKAEEDFAKAKELGYILK